jgi:hypothetical protein
MAKRQSPKTRAKKRESRVLTELLAIPRGIKAAAQRPGKERAIARKAAEAATVRAANRGKTLGQPAARLKTKEGGKTTATDVDARGRMSKRKKK